MAMGTPTGPQGPAGPGGPYPPEGYGPPPESYGPPPGARPATPPPQRSGPPQLSRPPLPRPPESFAQSGPSTPRPVDKGFMGSLLDLNFDYMVTTRLIKLVYVVALIGISLVSFVVAWYGLGFLRWNTVLGIMVLLAAPCG